MPGVEGLKGVSGIVGEPGLRGPNAILTLVDECTAEQGVCPVSSTCIDTELDYECQCQSGYTLQGNVCSGNKYPLLR